jgi:hypothetical protein
MTFAGYALGAVLLGIVVVSLCSTAVDLRRAVLPGWHGAQARLAELVLGSSAAVVLMEALGLVSLLRRPVLVLAAVALAVAVRFLPRRPLPDDVVAMPEQRGSRLLACGAVVLVLAQWLVSIHRNVRDGIHGYDALHYHLTFAAHFAQDHAILHTHRLDSLGVSTWYPLNSELLQGAGMVLLRTSALSLGIDLLAFVGVLLAAWVLGSRYGVGPAAVIATCLPLAALGPTYAGGSNNDWAAVWPLVAALALVVVGRRDGRLPLPVVAVVGLAGGLALGTKLTVLVPVVVLFIAVVVLSSGQRWRALGVLTGAHLLTGGYWFVRDLLVVGSPLPATKIGVGPLQLPKPATPVLDEQDFAVTHYLTGWSDFHHLLQPGLAWFFGPAWWAVLLAVAAGFVAVLVRSRRDGALLTAVLCGLGSIGGWLVTPTSAGGPDGEPFLFAVNIRYAMVGYVLGVLLLVVAAARTRLETPATGLLALLLLVTVVRRKGWAFGWPKEPLLVVVALAIAALVLWRLRHSGALVPVVAVAVVVGGLAGVHAAKRYDERTYQAGADRDTLFAAVRQETGQQVGVIGFPMQYPLFGPRLENQVAYVGKSGPEHSYDDFDTCEGLLAEVARMRLTRVVVQPYESRPTPEAEKWLKGDPHVRELVRTGAGAVYAIEPGVGPGSC